MSTNFPKCGNCGKLAIPFHLLERVKQADQERICRCNLLAIPKAQEKTKPIEEDKPGPAKIVMSRCEECGRSIIPAHLRGQMKDPVVLARVCQCHLMPQKVKVSEQPEPAKPVPQPEAPRQVVYVVNQTGKNSRAPSKLVAILLALFLGPFGIHRFFVGSNLLGTFYLLTSLFLIPMISFCTLGAGLFLYIPVYLANLLEILVWLLMSGRSWDKSFG